MSETVGQRIIKGAAEAKRLADLDLENATLRARLAEVKAENERLRAEVNVSLNGARPLPTDRETLGRLVREAWVRWAEAQPNPKPSWLVPYRELSEPDKEADRQIGETIARWTLIFDASERGCAWEDQVCAALAQTKETEHD